MMKSPSLMNPSFSSPKHTSFIALVRNSGINLVLVHRWTSAYRTHTAVGFERWENIKHRVSLLFELLPNRLMVRVSRLHLSLAGLPPLSPSYLRMLQNAFLSDIGCSTCSTSQSPEIFISKISVILKMTLYENPISMTFQKTVMKG
jgi:hypothetical protein